MSTVLQSSLSSDAAQPQDGPPSPPALKSFAHVSLPCRDLDEGKRFYGNVLGGRLTVDVPFFASFDICGVDIGIGTVGCTFLEAAAEYPHVAFFCGPAELIAWRDWLANFDVPTSPIWTRTGVEALMFFRDPSGNVLEFYCKEGFEFADELPRGPARGHGSAVDIDALRYDSWKMPSSG